MLKQKNLGFYLISSINLLMMSFGSLLATPREYSCSAGLYEAGRESWAVPFMNGERVTIDFEELGQQDKLLLNKTLDHEGRTLQLILSAEKTELDPKRTGELLFGLFVLDHTGSTFDAHKPTPVQDADTSLWGRFEAFGSLVVDGFILVAGLVQFYQPEAKDWKVTKDVMKNHVVFRAPVAPLVKIKKLLKESNYTSEQEFSQSVEVLKTEWVRLDCVH